MSDSTAGMRITITEDGPYVVSGGVPLIRTEIVTNEAGESVGWREIERIGAPDRYMLCRCGASESKPYCDASHMITRFHGEETAANDAYFESSACIDGPGVKLHDARDLCAEARFCDRAGGLWNLVERADEPGMRELIEEEASLCPSGRYTICDASSDDAVEPDLEPSIYLVEDPYAGCSGPIFVRGGIPIIGADGTEYEVRNRVTLCRCGESKNKPFCDGTHMEIEFRAE